MSTEFLSAEQILNRVYDEETGTLKTSEVSEVKKYVALLTQTGTNAPVVTVLENTLGEIVWSRFGAGVYKGTLNNAFPQNKTVLFTQNNSEASNFYLALWLDLNTVIVEVINAGADSIDDTLFNTPVEIRVYP
ncbi:MAG: hypothetical protein AB1757_21305 [Acidobacteriota bacterium]